MSTIDDNQSPHTPRVVMLGHSPLPFENLDKNYAPGARTWHFARAALDAGCKVLLLASRIPNVYDPNQEQITYEKKENLDYYSIDGSVFADKSWLKEKILEFNPECIVGVTTYPSSVVSDLDLDIPFWADLYGSIMAEAQAKAFLYNDNSYLYHFYKMEEKVLTKADIFSAVSEAQGFSLVGELGMWGRLSKETMGYRFVRVIPATADPKEFKQSKKVIRGKIVKDSDFVVLYSGGYNTWTDVETLFYGLEKAMSKSQNLVFVSTGGQLEGHDDFTYEKFKNKIQASQFADRFHLCGWVPREDLPNYYLESDLGINSDRYCYEALLGSRTRVLEWLSASLSFISTPLSEITKYLIDNNLAYGFEQGNSDDLANKLGAIVSDQNDLQLKREKLKKILDEEFTFESTTREFIEWVKKPSHSPDHGSIKLLNTKDSDFTPPIIGSIPLTHHLALSAWPMVAKSMKVLRLSKYTESVKRIGTKVATKSTQPTPINESEDYRAKISEISISEMEVGKKYEIPISVKNIGKAVWDNPSNPDNTVNLSFLWKNKKEELIFKSKERIPLQKSIKPGKKFSASLTVECPQSEVECILQIDLVKENHFWFSEVGSEKCEKLIKIKKNNKSLTNAELPLVSTIVVTFNSEKFISECLDSILQSNYPNLEIIVVDNGSKDNTLNKLQKYVGKIKLIETNKNLGFASGNNLGILKSKGEIIIMINPDAFVTKDALKELVIPFVKDEQIMITGSKLKYPGTNKIQSAGAILHKNGLTDNIGNGEEDTHQYDFEKIVDYVNGAAIAIRKKLFQITGLFDPIYNPAYFEELDKCIQARKLNYKVIYEPKSVVYHHESTTLGVLSEKFLKLYHTNRFKFIYKNSNLRSYFVDFLPAEINWFFFHCPISQRSLVLKTHLKVLFSPKRIFMKQKNIEENYL